jgi:hypothetical protein
VCGAEKRGNGLSIQLQMTEGSVAPTWVWGTSPHQIKHVKGKKGNIAVALVI